MNNEIIITSIGFIIFALLVQYYRNLINSLKNNLKSKNQELENQLELRILKEETDKNKNENLEKTKMAILNILEDARELEVKLKQEKNFSESIVATMNEGLFIIDNQNKVVLANDSALKMFRLQSKNDLIGKYLTDILKFYKKADQLKLEDRPLYKTLMTGEPTIVSLEDDYFAESDFVKLPIALTTKALRIGPDSYGALMDFHDLTKEKEIKEKIEQEVADRTKELNDEKSKLTASIEALSKAFVMLDLEGKVILNNKNLNTIFNSNNNEWNLLDIQGKLGTSFDFIKAYKQNIKSREREEYDNIAYGSRVLQIRFSTVYSGEVGSRVPIGSLAIIGDVTEEKILERSKDEFFSIASHELRTPLTAIRGNTSMMLEYYKDQFKDPELNQMVNDTHDASIRLIGIVNDFLDLSRLEQGRIEYKTSDLLLSDIVSNVVDDMQATAKEKNISLISNIDSKVKVKADPDKLKQVLFNIIGNSIKFTTIGGVAVSTETENNFVKIKIADTGAGIPLANQALLFHKFQQAGKSITTRDGAKGTGLGLYISKLMVEGMGGEIKLESSVEGKGSVFTFTLPAVSLK